MATNDYNKLDSNLHLTPSIHEPLEILWMTPFREWFRGEVIRIDDEGLYVRRISPSVSQCYLTWNQLDPVQQATVRKHFNGEKGGQQ